jgi:asparagine synthase (glutamine-hydrolysing)
MCGLAGFVAAQPGPPEDLMDSLRPMCEAIAHRGPDDTGEWIDAACGVALGFRRLAIIDISPTGHQPMVSASGRYVVTLNGEIYNFETLRVQLEEAKEAPPFRGHSDTEVLLAAFDAWGVEAAVKRLNGMFAIALWDRKSRRLHLIRDRMGVKPLYYGWAGRTFLYGSELTALRRHPGFSCAIDRVAVQLYFRFLYVPAPFSIYENARKLMPGTTLTFDPATGRAETTVYWAVSAAAIHGVRHRFRGSEMEASQELEALLGDAVRMRMVADVPVGAFLSGGVDSSLVTALMQAQRSTPVRTFSLGFTEGEYDEAPYAASVARYLGTDHTELYVTPDDIASVIPKLPSMYGEPFADSSQIPTHLVAMLARRQVTVGLSGDGGDEVFGGYSRYAIGEKLFRRLATLPVAMRPAIGRALASLPASIWNRILAVGRPLLPAAFRRPYWGERLHKLARMIAARTPDAMYFELISYWTDLTRHAMALESPLAYHPDWQALSEPVDQMMFLDQTSYLPDDILTKVDRASMAASLEVRAPLLDYRIVEFSWTLPLSMKGRNGQGKRVVRRVLDRYVPKSLSERPKMGFSIPLESLLRGRLRDWAESLLDPAAIGAQGLLDAELVGRRWSQYVGGDDHWKNHIWGVLMFQAWMETERCAQRVVA